jgi:hypothetical protein
MIRYTDGSQKVLSSSDFDKETKNRRESDSYWQTIKTIQLVPTSKFGIGKVICFEFVAIGFKSKINDLTNRHDVEYN